MDTSEKKNFHGNRQRKQTYWQKKQNSWWSANIGIIFIGHTGFYAHARELACRMGVSVDLRFRVDFQKRMAVA